MNLGTFLKSDSANGRLGLSVGGISNHNGDRDFSSVIVDTAGDINGDGADDLIYLDPDLNAGDGRLFLIYGQPVDVARPSDGKYEVELKIGSTVTGLAFGEVPTPGEIRGQVFRDLNDDANKDAGEVGFDSVQVYVDRNDNGVLDEGEPVAQTDQNGRYLLSELDAGTEQVIRQVAPSGVRQTQPPASDDFAYRVTLISGQVLDDADFGNHDLIRGVGAADISGRIFDDANADGELNDGEAGIPGVTVFVDLNRNGLRESDEPSVESDTNGAYRFASLGAGVYNVRTDLSATTQVSSPRGSDFAIDTLATGEAPQVIRSGLINDDQFPDLVTANFETNDLTVLLNDGAGGFTELDRIPVGAGPASIAIGDVDGDGTNDLVIGHQFSSFVGVLSGNGDGSFSSMRRVDAGDGPRGVALVDFDQRNGLDIAVANQFSDDVSILSNSGDGTFTLGVTIPVGAAPTSIASGNFDNEFGPDLVVTNSFDATVTVIRNSAGNTHFAPTTFASGLIPFQVATADIDEDGHVDLAVANTGSDTVSLFFGRGDGTFGSSVDLPAGSGASSVTIADLEGDGMNDLLVTNATSQNLAVLRGLGDRRFQSPQNFGVAQIPVTLAWDIAADDFDGNGSVDIAVANGDADSVSIMANNPVLGSYRLPLEGDESVGNINFGIVGGTCTAALEYRRRSAQLGFRAPTNFMVRAAQ